MKRVVVVQPHVPAYRVAFYRHLVPELAARGIELTLAHGRPWGKDTSRGYDERLPGAIELPQQTLRCGPRHLVRRRLGSLAHDCDALVLTQSLHAMESYRPLLRSGGPPVGLWGHGATYTRPEPGPLRSAKRLLTNRADWFFAYTEAGARHVVAGGFPARRLTVLHNTIDTTSLVAAGAAVDDADRGALRRQYGLRQGRTGLYIGGLDAAKRIPFLLVAARAVAAALPGFRLLVAGDGAQRTLVEEAERSGAPVRYMGTANDGDKARLGAVADVLMVPGAVGLVAVDSFALGTPLITTLRAAHGPEFSYLQHGRNALIVDAPTPRPYAAHVTRLLEQPERLARFSAACRADAALYTVQEMARRFADGVEGLVDVRCSVS
ncbi:glycosyltransferase family 4 protein [Streptomyces sp. NPDC005181]|uniref:glycosyltransferase family 4 protein n=1 Tax=Streptomyces sp. NPDC005181 TaxID=3156869 RepID=UPI0033A169B0